jgi:hypothetical protein
MTILYARYFWDSTLAYPTILPTSLVVLNGTSLETFDFRKAEVRPALTLFRGDRTWTCHHK